MSNATLADQLDQAVDIFIAHPSSLPLAMDLELGELLGIVAELRILPSPEFRAQLRADLQHRADSTPVTSIPAYKSGPAPVVQILPKSGRSVMAELETAPSLFDNRHDGYPIHRSSFVTAFLMHAATVVLLAASGLWMRDHELKKPVVTVLIEPVDFALPPALDRAHGGGGGGDADKLQASRGGPPRFSSQQLTPPTVVVRNSDPALAAEPTVVGPPNLTFPQTGQMGDPLSAALTPSNGTGVGGGIGSSTGGGVGGGNGPGVGYGKDGGMGGGIFRVGGGVSAPRAVYDPEPDYSEEARKAKYQGAVALWVVVGSDGRPRDIRVWRSLGMGLDEKAIETVRTWRFAPAMKDGQPVAVEVNIEIDFRLY